MPLDPAFETGGVSSADGEMAVRVPRRRPRAAAHAAAAGPMRIWPRALRAPKSGRPLRNRGNAECYVVLKSRSALRADSGKRCVAVGFLFAGL